MKLKVQAQYLQPGDVVGSGEVVQHVTVNALQMPSNKVAVTLMKHGLRAVLWGKYTMINVERKEKLQGAEAIMLHKTLNDLGIK